MKYLVTVIEVLDAGGSRAETTVEVDAPTPSEAMALAKPPHKAKYGRTYKIAEVR